jgi:hypothetical protein
MRWSACSTSALLALLFLSVADVGLCQQLATTVQLPTFGVAIDAEGVLKVKTFAAPHRSLLRKRLEATKATVPDDVFVRSKMRKISLNRLEDTIRVRLAAGEAPDDTTQHLAGLQRLQYVFFFPESGEIVIAGPAEGWIEDASGRTVGITSGRPVLLLEDLLVSLRAYLPDGAENPFVGCTISPRQEGLARLAEFQRTIPSTIPNSRRAEVTAAIAKGVHDSLGMANIHVYGISNKTHFAQVLIEADYRMKRIAIGLERPPVRMTTFIDAVRAPRHLTLQRWWFTPNYDCVKVTEDRLAMELVGQGVQLQSQDKRIGTDGRLSDALGPKPSKAAQLYTKAFTAKYPEIAAASPVYAQLRNQIDMLVAAAFIRQQDYYGRAAWTADLLMDEASLPTETWPNPTKVDCAVNVFWRGNRLLCPAGGGVSIQADDAIQQGRWLSDKDRELGSTYAAVSQRVAVKNWWWD